MRNLERKSSRSAIDFHFTCSSVQRQCGYNIYSFEFSPSTKGASMQSRQGLTCLALMCERYNVSDSAGAVIASAVLNDFEVIGDDNSTVDNYRLYFKTVWPCQFCSCNNLCKISRFVGRTPSGN